MGRRALRRLLLLVAAAVALSACGDDASAPDIAAPKPEPVTIGPPTEIERGDRHIELEWWFPDGPGPFPLVVFGHGLGADLSDHERFKSLVADAGYVVVAPKFPGTSRGAPDGPDPDDVVEQPADVSVILDELPSRVDPDRVAVMGHSFGAVTSWWLTSNTCCLDDRIDAAVLLAPAPREHPGGTEDHGRQPPTLVVHGDADESLPYADAVQLFDRLREPKKLVTITGGDHNSWVRGGVPGFDVAVDAVLEFLEEHLR